VTRRPTPLERIALLAIRAYQRYLSPYKGFSCALRVATGGDSCSGYGYKAIRRRGLRVGLGLLRRRMALCGHIYRQAVTIRNPMLHPQQGHCDLPCDCDLDLLGSALDTCGQCGGCDGFDWFRSRNKKALTAEQAALEERIARKKKEKLAERAGRSPK
jgi:putative component of membrane protein insertase Oxa1/YidC/SpoIIIJ protein YidD